MAAAVLARLALADSARLRARVVEVVVGAVGSVSSLMDGDGQGRLSVSSPTTLFYP